MFVTALTVGELTGYLSIDDRGWRRGLADARAQLQRVAQDSSGDLTKLANKTEKAGDRASAVFVRLALAISNVATAAAAVQGVAGVVAGLGGALAVLPALGAAVGVGLAAAMVGMSGFGEAMKAVGDPAKFAESLERLSPAARETAIAIRDLGPAWRSVQQATQDALFAGVAKDVRVLGAVYLPVLKSGLSGVAAEFNTAAHGTASFLAQSSQVQTVSVIFGQVRASIGDVSAAMAPLVSILLDLVAVGSQFLPGLSGGFSSAAERAAEFVREARETGRLHEWISEGLSTLRQLGELLGNVGGIVRAVFSGLDTGGASLLDILVRATGQMRAFLQSAEGQQALAALGALLDTVSTVVTDVLLTALRQLAPIIVALAPGFAQLATQVGSILVAALTAAGPLLVQLATFLSNNASWLGPLAIGLYGAAKAFGVVTAAVRILNIVSALNPWVIIIAATVALAVLIVTNWDTITQAVRTAVGWVVDAVGWLGELPGRVAAWFGQLTASVISALGDAVAWVRGLPGRILGALGDLGGLLYNAGADIVRGLLSGLGSLAGAIWDKIVSMVSDAWHGVLDFFGIGSPSRLAQAAGVNIGRGLIVGIDAMADRVNRAFTDMVTMPPIPTTTIPAPRIAAPAGLGPSRPAAAAPTPAAEGDPFATDRRATVRIDQFHATPAQSPHEIASELDWLSRTGG